MSFDRASTAREAVAEWIGEVLKQKRWTGTDLARHADLAPSTVLRILNDPKHRFVPSLSTLQKISRASGIEIPKTLPAVLIGGSFESQPGVEREPSRAEKAFRREVPLRAVSKISANLRQRAAEEKRSVPAIMQFSDDQSLAAFYMPDNTLSPWFKAGCLMYTSERREPVEGDLILLACKDGRSVVRLLTRINANSLSLASAREDDSEEVGFGEVDRISVVVASVSTT